MTDVQQQARRLMEQSNAPNFRLPANCLKGMRLPAKICYSSKQSLCLDFHGSEYIFDRRNSGDKRVSVIFNPNDVEHDPTEKVVTLNHVFENMRIQGALIDLSTGDIVLQAVDNA